MERSRVALIIAFALHLLIAACSDDGGGSSSDGAPADNPRTKTLIGGDIQGVPLPLSGVVTTIAGSPRGADGTGAAANLLSPTRIASDGTNLYLADGAAIRKVEIATGKVTLFAGAIGLSGSGDGIGSAARFSSSNAGGITSDGTNLYVADFGNHTIRKIEIATATVTTLAGLAGSPGTVDGTGSAARFNFPISITNDGANLYVAGGGTVRKIVIASGAVTTIAGSPTNNTLSDGVGAAAGFLGIAGLVVVGTNLYVLDVHRLRRIDLGTTAVTTIAGSTNALSGYADGTGTSARFNFTSSAGLATDGTTLYMTDDVNQVVRQIPIATLEVTTIAGSPGTAGFANGTGTAALFNSPKGIVVLGGQLYIADGNFTLRQMALASGAVTTLAGAPRGADGVGAAARIDSPRQITTDGTNIYVADTANHTIRRVEIATRTVTTLAGTNGVPGVTDGTGTAAQFRSLFGLTTDGVNLYVADTGNHTIRKVVIATRVVTTIAGNPGSSGSTDGIGAAALFNSPRQLTVHGGFLYVSDSLNHTIRRVALATGEVTTLASVAGAAGYADDIGAAARFNTPNGIATDGANLYVTDSLNHAIRVINLATRRVTTLAGFAGLSGSTDGIGSGARFSSPSGINTDGINVFVADTGNHVIRRIVIATAQVTTIAGTRNLAGTVDGVGIDAQFSSPVGLTTDGNRLFIGESGGTTIREMQ